MIKKLLLIDDEKEMTDLAGGYLTRHGYQVECCNDPAAALRLLEATAFDAVLVDLMMSPLDGISLIRRLRELPGHAATPLFVLSAKLVSDEERREIMSFHAQFLAKPIHPRRLLETLQGRLGTA